MKPQSFAIVWSFQVADEHREAFERAYGPIGDWAKLFGTSQGYLRTDLMVSDEGRYLTIDHWRSQEDFHAFQARSGADYLALDARTEGWTLSEERLGQFMMLEEEAG